jgi:hypothetical protein
MLFTQQFFDIQNFIAKFLIWYYKIEKKPLEVKPTFFCFLGKLKNNLQEVQVSLLPSYHKIVKSCKGNDLVLLRPGVLKLYLLVAPTFVFRNLMTLQDALRPSRFKNNTKEGLIWELLSQTYTKIINFKVWRPFSGNWRPSKGSRPLV